ncbi:MAG: ATP-binding cassette domain-containing protein, partial [Actinomycetota bacterium]|nr:ATP-binding cassette domain-containing protein [Actinomycetota bacterium]
MIVFDSVEKRYGANVVLAELDFTVQPGEHVTLIGPSGSGKTTILRLLMTLEKVDAGTIRVGGTYLSHMEKGGRLVPADEKHRREVRKRIGMVFQQFNLFPNMT